ncbi:Phytanoyl-CoA dioxygenase [Penicillium bovifimosum]|uniref:Phytanoyl-CoA dioxygenase n=1 Tax=Penicillium bovifimosum TaxID=126998 RepID=A0A9W9L9Q6_9EURO|nr:Phytanoyl-CoA dioxygenase [Penicillium bovifimosum]KAJ5143687.1 Phytanoyl-CoA dioxygenase [Penicillium bovifimosum]
MNGHSKVTSRLYSSPQLTEFQEICSQTTDPTTYPLANDIQSNIPIYDLPALESTLTATLLTRLQDEWHHILHKGPGVYILRSMYPSPKYTQTLTSTNEAFNAIIARERTHPTKKGDHFAAANTNDRIWNAFSKHALQDPSSFLSYYSNPWLAAVAEAWLGPGYRLTAQVNAVHPGGAAQNPHRDYHLGFADEEVCRRYPAATQLASQFLTLQGAVAHSEMPLDSGPTRFLPFSQLYGVGYLGWRRQEFREFFEERFVALPMELGDGVFFNPGLFHAAGANEMGEGASGISCAFGKSMESVDCLPIVDVTWDLLVERYRGAGGMAGDLDLERYSVEQREIRAFVKAVAEGYPFPTNLDRRPPGVGGMAPESEQDVIMRGLEEGWDRKQVVDALEQMRVDSRA